jgi:hypothetical protein
MTAPSGYGSGVAAPAMGGGRLIVKKLAQAAVLRLEEQTQSVLNKM